MWGVLSGFALAVVDVVGPSGAGSPISRADLTLMLYLLFPLFLLILHLHLPPDSHPVLIWPPQERLGIL